MQRYKVGRPRGSGRRIGGASRALDGSVATAMKQAKMFARLGRLALFASEAPHPLFAAVLTLTAIPEERIVYR